MNNIRYFKQVTVHNFNTICNDIFGVLFLFHRYEKLKTDNKKICYWLFAWLKGFNLRGLKLKIKIKC